jgi:hypothetical protein
MDILLRQVAFLALSLSCIAQVVPRTETWSERFDSAGAKLVLAETGRTRLNGRTVVTYSLFATGFPSDSQFTLWSRLVGREPQPAANAFVNSEGKVVSQLADPKNHIAEDPMNLKVFAGKGEPKQFALISGDGQFRAFAQVTPFPIETTDGVCHLFAEMTSQNYYSVSIHVTGLQPNADLLVDTQSDSERAQREGKASDRGTYDSAVLPAVQGKRSGKFRFSVATKACKVSIEMPWGLGSYGLQ